MCGGGVQKRVPPGCTPINERHLGGERGGLDWRGHGKSEGGGGLQRKRFVSLRSLPSVKIILDTQLERDRPNLADSIK